MSPFPKVVKTVALAAMVAAGGAACAIDAATDANARPRRAVHLAARDGLDLLRFDETPKPPVQAKFFTINSVLAKLDGHGHAAGSKSGNVQLAALSHPDLKSDSASTAPQIPAVSAEPFGLFTFRAPEGALWQKWRAVQGDMVKDQAMLDRCRDEMSSCSSYAAQFSRLVDAVKAKAGRARLDEANRAVNIAIRYVSDMMQYGVPDRWSSALSTFATAKGDCEDYAIAKYAALSAAGMSSDDLRIVLVRDRSINEDHAVLTARLDGRWIVLDNRRAELADDTDVKSYTPLYALNDRGVQLFATPYARADGDALPAAEAQATPAWTGESKTQDIDHMASGSAMLGELPLLM